MERLWVTQLLSRANCYLCSMAVHQLIAQNASIPARQEIGVSVNSAVNSTGDSSLYQQQLAVSAGFEAPLLGLAGPHGEKLQQHACKHMPRGLGVQHMLLKIYAEACSCCAEHKHPGAREGNQIQQVMWQQDHACFEADKHSTSQHTLARDHRIPHNQADSHEV